MSAVSCGLCQLDCALPEASLARETVCPGITNSEQCKKTPSHLPCSPWGPVGRPWGPQDSGHLLAGWTRTCLSSGRRPLSQPAAPAGGGGGLGSPWGWDGAAWAWSAEQQVPERTWGSGQSGSQACWAWVGGPTLCRIPVWVTWVTCYGTGATPLETRSGWPTLVCEHRSSHGTVSSGALLSTCPCPSVHRAGLSVTLLRAVCTICPYKGVCKACSPEVSQSLSLCLSAWVRTIEQPT